MRPDRRQILSGLALTPALFSPVLAACARAEPRHTWHSAGFESLAAAAQNLVTNNETAGIAIGMSSRGLRKSAYFGLASVASSKPVDAETKFRLASITKPITAACILKLAEAGLLDIGASIDLYFPDFPRAQNITIHHLLTHTSGLANWWDRLPDGAPADFMDMPNPHLVLAKMKQPFLFAPGTMHAYSNSGYILLGEIIEQASGVSYEEALQRYVLSKVGAEGIELERTGAGSEDWAQGYGDMASGLGPIGTTAMPYAAGGLRANMLDLLACSDAIFHGKVLSSDLRQQMFSHAMVADGRRVQEATYTGPESPAQTPIAGETEMGYGYGINTWVQYGERFYSHAGAIDGFAAYLVYSPRTLTSIAMLANTQGATTSLHQSARDVLIGGQTFIG